MKAKFLFPHGNYSGNVLWRKGELPGNEPQLALSLARLTGLGYWVSPFPEGDGVTFNDKVAGRSEQQVFDDFCEAFPWLDVSIGTHGSSNQELAGLEAEADEATTLDCIVIVPIERIHFEASFKLGPFRLVCARELDHEPHERLADWEGSYLQFETRLEYVDLLRLNRNFTDNDVVILKCLTLAEHAMDVVRFRFSSFDQPHFTPNPAGQLDDGTYAVEIIPLGQTHLKPVNLKGISHPMSVSNNWLGPEIDDSDFPARAYIEKVLGGSSDELALSVKSTLRSCRQAFYTIGDESRFLTLVFALDGLVHPEKKWSGWKHRTYIAALISHGDVRCFQAALARYDELYSDVRNSLVHHGKDFFELAQDSAMCCQDIYGYINDVVNLIADSGFTTVNQMHTQATNWLKTPHFIACFQQEITRINNQKQTQSPIPAW